MSARVLIGTCSWTDKTLIDSEAFYPRKRMTAEERLRFYAQNFPIVEVDSLYYVIPDVRNSELWAERTPEGFLFIKAFRLFTGHGTQANGFPKDLAPEIQAATGNKPRFYYRDLPENIRDHLWMLFERPSFLSARPESWASSCSSSPITLCHPAGALTIFSK